MAAGAVSSVRDPQHEVRWKWLLLGLCGLCAMFLVFTFADALGIGGRPWGGWWDAEATTTDRPFVSEWLKPEPGGAAARAGLRYGDRTDLREQSLDTRVAFVFSPMATRPVTVRVKRGARTLAVNVLPSTTLEGRSLLKVTGRFSGSLPAVWFLACATLIAKRRWWAHEARMLSLAMLCQICGLLLASGVYAVPGATPMLLLYVASGALLFAETLLLVALASQYGKRTGWRRLLEWCAYAMNAIVFLAAIAVVVGIVTLWFDPTPLLSPFLGTLVGANMAFGYAFDAVALFAVVATAVAAVANTPLAERARAGWLLLPLPLTLFAVCIVSASTAYAPSYSWYIWLYVLAQLSWLLGGFVVTYALLKRRVLDFGFVLNRAVVVSIVGLVVLIAFVLLEWMLGSVLAGVSHTTGLIANAALALLIGVSLSYIHKRVDQSVDLVLFRKRHEDERALLAFSKEAAYVTEWDALLDATLEKVRRHTDARNASVLIGTNGFYNAVREFGDNTVASVNENDEAILALKVWHKPIDPHHYDAAIHAALALPMLTRGRLYGVLLLGERAGGEAYAPDEVEALSQLANGVGSALEALSLTTDGGVTPVAEELKEMIGLVADAIAEMRAEIRALHTSSPA